MLENLTKEKQIEIAVRLYENNAYGTTFGKGMYRRALFNGTIDSRSPSVKYLVDCFRYADWSNQATTDEQMAVLAAVEADDQKLYSWITHYDTATRAKRLVGGCMQLDLGSLHMSIMICDFDCCACCCLAAFAASRSARRVCRSAMGVPFR